MVFTRTKAEGITRACKDDKSDWYGLLATVGTFLDSGILTEAKGDRDRWLFIPKDITGERQEGTAYLSKEDLKVDLKKQFA